jgi:hypothetical protein
MYIRCDVREELREAFDHNVHHRCHRELGLSITRADGMNCGTWIINGTGNTSNKGG